MRLKSKDRRLKPIVDDEFAAIIRLNFAKRVRILII